jgi:pSer/pThr/pTyr-binding forkhead associated (FHA) protein
MRHPYRTRVDSGADIQVRPYEAVTTYVLFLVSSKHCEVRYYENHIHVQDGW